MLKSLKDGKVGCLKQALYPPLFAGRRADFATSGTGFVLLYIGFVTSTISFFGEKGCASRRRAVN
jgi:hypothetical protein